MSQTGRGGTDRRARIAAQRAAEHRARVRARMLLAGGAIVAVVAIVVAFALLSGGNRPSGTAGPAAPAPTGAELTAVVTKVTSVPPSALERVGAGLVTQTPTNISGQPLTASGKPEVLYIGAEYCPFCAAERWALIVALSRFGTFTGLAATHSAAKNGAGNAEPFPNTSTFTFASAAFTSRYLTFTSVETQTNIPDPATGGYTSLQTPTAEQQAVFSKYGAASGGAIPFIDYGNRYLSVGASYDPRVLNGLTWQQVAATLHNPNTRLARSVLGAANFATAAICGITGDQPASACTPAVLALRSRILRSGHPEVPLSFLPSAQGPHPHTMYGMGKASRTKQAPDRRAKIAAQQAAERRRHQIQRIYWAGGSIIAVVAVVLAFVLVSQNHNGTASAGRPLPTGAALSKLTSQVTGIPSSVTDQIGGGNVSASQFVPASQLTSAAQNLGSYLATVNGKALTANGKPEILYLGAEYCPYCAAERWSMINALSRFGTFSNLSASHSSTSDVYPDTATFTFYKSKYTSQYITFTPVEETTNYRQGNSSDQTVSYVPLQTPTSAQAALGQAYDPGGAIPFLDLGNKYVEVGNLSPWGPQVIQGKTWAQIATALSDPKSPIGTGAIGNANYLTAGICSLTNNQPATACTPAIQALEANLSKG